MAQPIDVLVVVVNYKSARLTLQLLETLRTERSAYPHMTLRTVVVENASGDVETLRAGIAAGFGDWVTLIVSDVNAGYGAGNNLGLRAAQARGISARYVHFLNPDTEVRPGGVHELLRFMDAHPRAGIAGSSYEHADGTPWPIAFRFPSHLSELESACSLRVVSALLKDHAVPRHMGSAPAEVDWLPGASLMVRREVIERIGGFDEEFFLYFEETDFCRRTREHGWQTWYVPQSRIMHVRGQSTGVTALDREPQRLPDYWYESRRRYFAKNHGYSYAALADLAFLAGHSVGGLKRVLKRQPNTPHLFRDFLRNTVLLRRNRQPLPPERSAV